jgi:hypothetical protein
MIVVLMNTFFLSIAIGIFASAVSRDYRAAMAANFFLWLMLVAAPAACGVALDIARSLFLPPLFYSCPVFSFFMCEDTNYGHMQDAFWWSIVVTNALAWGLVVMACRIVPRTWGDKPARTPSRKRQWRDSGSLISYGSPGGRIAFRKWALDANAYFWLASRAWLKMAHVWAFIIFSILWWFYCWAKNGHLWLDEATFFATAIVLNSTLKLWITLEAGQRLGEDRRGGGFELLLATPLTVADILGGQIMALRRQFLKPLVVALCAETIFLAMLWEKPAERWMFLALMLMIPADIAALVCVSMRAALTSKSPARINVIAVSRILVLPWALFGLLQVAIALIDWLMFLPWQPKTYVQVAQWCGISLVVDLFFGGEAWRSLRRDFRALATMPAESRFSLRKAAAHTRKVAGQIVPARFRIPLLATVCVLALLAIVYVARPRAVDPPIVISLAQSNGPVRIFRAGGQGVFFVMPDGTLWRWGKTEASQPIATIPEQIGTNYNWRKAVGNGSYWLGLNSEGTILESGLKSNLPRFKWADIGVGAASSIGLAKNGMIWAWNGGKPGLIGTASNWIAVASPNASYLALRADGTLWTWGRILAQNGAIWVTTNIAEPTLVCADTNWISLNANGQARNRAGELWNAASSVPNPNAPAASVCWLISDDRAANNIESAPFWMNNKNRPSTRPNPWNRLQTYPASVQTGGRTDWVSIWGLGGTALGMTADGTIWVWGVDLGRDPHTRFQSLATRLNAAGGYSGKDPLFLEKPRPLMKLTHRP